jgi:two-component system CheB/CheR fusion protein
VLDAVNHRGRKIRCHVTCSPLIAAGGKREGAILMMEEVA